MPRDPIDAKDAILEIKAGEGGEESALFAGDLLRMYSRYAEDRGWRLELLDEAAERPWRCQERHGGGEGPGRSREPGEAPYALLKFEGGVHRVQRVPVTESQGRIHTSAAGVLVMPEAEPIDVTIDDNDLRIDVFRSSGPGRPERQHDRLGGADHPPADRARSCRARTRRASCRTASRRCACCGRGCSSWRRRRPPPTLRTARRSQIRTVDRSERIRTYNFPENRITDHRVGYKAHNLDHVLGGELQAVIDACVDADLAERLAAVESPHQ